MYMKKKSSLGLHTIFSIIVLMNIWTQIKKNMRFFHFNKSTKYNRKNENVMYLQKKRKRVFRFINACLLCFEWIKAVLT